MRCEGEGAGGKEEKWGKWDTIVAACGDFIVARSFVLFFFSSSFHVFSFFFLSTVRVYV